MLSPKLPFFPAVSHARIVAALDPRDLVTPGNHPRARVGFSVGTQHNFGEVKVTATVTYECDQNTATIDRAGLACFNKAVELMTDGLTILTTKEPA